MMNSLIAPTSTTIETTNAGKKIIHKTSIQDAKNTFLLIVKSENDIISKIDQ